MKQRISICIVVLLLFTLGCTGNQSPNQNGNSTAPLKEFSITAKQFEFVPETITVTKGDRVKITLLSSDVQHGFSLPEFGAHANINPGTSTTVEFVANQTGRFSFSCSVFCGDGHSDMKGTLIVQVQ